MILFVGFVLIVKEGINKIAFKSNSEETRTYFITNVFILIYLIMIFLALLSIIILVDFNYLSILLIMLCILILFPQISGFLFPLFSRTKGKYMESYERHNMYYMKDQIKRNRQTEINNLCNYSAIKLDRTLTLSKS